MSDVEWGADEEAQGTKRGRGRGPVYALRTGPRASVCVCVQRRDTELTNQPSEEASRSGERVYALALALAHRPLTPPAT